MYYIEKVQESHNYVVSQDNQSLQKQKVEPYLEHQNILSITVTHVIFLFYKLDPNILKTLLVIKLQNLHNTLQNADIFNLCSHNYRCASDNT